MTRAGNPPIDTVGVVDIYAPTSTPYYRMKWTQPDGTPGDTTAGRTLEQARLKATEINGWLGAAAGPFAVTRLDVMRDQFLAEAISPFTGEPWKLSQLTQVRIRMNRMLRGQQHYRAMDVDRPRCDVMRAQAGTRNMVKQNTSVLRAFLRWGHQHENKYFTAEQAELLPDGVSMPNPSIKGTAMPKRRRRACAVGESEGYVRPEDAPSAAQVVRLRQELAVSFPLWGELGVELAADAGPRWGEQMQLTAYDVHLAGCAAYGHPHLHIDWQIDPGATANTPGGRRCEPKGGKTRTTGAHEFSFTGFPVRAALQARVEAALKEQEAGTNPQALLFPAKRGGLLWYTSFEAKALLPAMRRAGWPLESWTEVRDQWSEQTRQYTRVERERTTALLPWHGLRHRFARTLIDVHKATKGELMALGGWENEQTVSNRYYKSGKLVGGGAELSRLHPPTAGLIRDAHVRHHRGLVHVQPGAPLDQRLHPELLHGYGDRPEGPHLMESDVRARSGNAQCPRPPRPTHRRARRHQCQPTSRDGTSIFIPARWPEPGPRPLTADEPIYLVTSGMSQNRPPSALF